MFGASIFFGDAAQDEFDDEGIDAFTSIVDVHAEYKFRQFEFRALGVLTNVNDTEALNIALDEVVGEEQFGWYVEAAYNILPDFLPQSNHYLAPFVRYESLDVQNDVAEGFTKSASSDQNILTLGLTYKPVNNVVLKLDYRNFSSPGEGADADEVAFGIGYVF